MSKTYSTALNAFSSELGQIIRKFLEDTHRHIDLSLEGFALRESRDPGVVVELVFRGYTFEALEGTDDGIMPKPKNYYIYVHQDDEGTFFLRFSQGFYLIEGYSGMKMVRGNTDENNRHFLASFYTCINDIISLGERYDVAIASVVTPGNFFQSFKLQKEPEKTYGGYFFVFEEAHGSYDRLSYED